MIIIIKAVAPNLRIAVSEEPKPEIAERSDYGPCGYDIWIAYIKDYKKDYAWQRQRDYGETVWFYSLPQDDLPYFSPCKDGNNFMLLLLLQSFPQLLEHYINNFVFYMNNNILSNNCYSYNQLCSSHCFCSSSMDDHLCIFVSDSNEITPS